MRITNIKINGYGNIENKDIDFKEGINIVYGKNESGKSTMLSYIVNTLYGISKNKDGKDISDYEKYKPWNSAEFSGRISYKLDNNEQYEVFRDFNKKNPKIYNGKLEEITSKFDVDKKDGSKFFQEQTGVDKQTYLSTVVSMQQAVKLEEKEQNILIQKIANLAGTGEDNVSYKKAQAKLQEKIRDEIGTSKTTQKPINIIEKEILELNKKIEEIKPYKNKKYDIDTEKEEINTKIKELEQEKEILTQLKNSVEEEQSSKKEIAINQNNQKENTIKMQSLQENQEEEQRKINEVEQNINKKSKEIEEYKKEQETIEQNLANIQTPNEDAETDTDKEKNTAKSNAVYIIIGVLLIILAIASVTVIKNYILTGITAILFAINIALAINKIKNQKKEESENKSKIQKELNQSKIKLQELEKSKSEITEKINSKLQELEQSKELEKQLNNNSSMLKGQIILLEKNNEELQKNLQVLEEKLVGMQESKEQNIISKYQNKIDAEKLETILKRSKENAEQLSLVENSLNDLKIKLKGLEIEEKTIIPQIDNIVSLKEKLELNYEKKEQLKNREEIINIAIENLQEAYEEMKNTITPKFTKSLSSSIEKISNSKYNKVTINDENGMIVENNRGEYIEAGKLSLGTIDQLYLALRLSMINDLSEETLPIILDESFAYFDNQRLENVLKYLSETLKEHQTIIFTCSNREQEILDNLKINYNYVELNPQNVNK